MTRLRKLKVLSVIAPLFIVAIYISGCATQTTYTNTTKTHVSQSSNELTESNVDEKIRGLEKNHSVSDIRIIALKNVEGHGFAFASFSLDGQVKYANIYDSSIGAFTAAKANGHPLQYVASYRNDGFNSITGVVVNTSEVKNIIITFSNGSIQQVPVVHGDFWFVEKIGSSSRVKQVLGVTSSGAVVTNNP